ncbi:AraC family transcriptional regulator [Aestuariimicrobium sp. T2.26MG-19.2B]|uniref:AraC family transcriptional regulator n=1 Tax=Aestuariimicrobium sp. T2.26MG-19.2B TaxID=3040679 RepID=UPI002477370C|nr:AraC family transcriptional regulator [Aestuariimicrobium sp. T2.26MG-19.2B]CAI9406501.1 HTH-type transcriptional activator RhaR [Aestuariimicrobium sp. T2.26MG-19.2B]
MDDGVSQEDYPEGFPGQRLRVLPRPVVDQARQRALTGPLLVTDAGFFPKARHHSKSRRSCAEHIVILCTQGEGEVTLDGTNHRVRAGEVVVLPAGRPHRYHADPEVPWTIWWVHVTGTRADALIAALRATPQQPVFRVAEVTRVSALVDSILRRLETDETMTSLVAASGAAWHLLTALVADGRPLTRLGSRQDPVADVIAHIQTNVSAHLSVPELAALAGWSTSHFSAMFRRATGFGPLEYQTRLRMSTARTLLDTTDRTIASIATEVGYPDSLYFSRQFRRIHQVSPSQYRSREQSAGGQD